MSPGKLPRREPAVNLLGKTPAQRIMPLASLFHRGPRRSAVMAAYHRIVERSREPLFFARWGVPDTLDGRFEALALHGFLVLNRLKSAGPAAAGFAQDLFDAMFVDLDRGLREMGATDIGVGRHVKAMARSFYGRVRAYEEGLAGGDEVLTQALRRNLYGTVDPAPEHVGAMARYLRRQAAALAAASEATLLRGEVPFTPVEEG
jgi:cytochrome b pre-mRNA-processing protein 3